jgi:hypothetical protein
LGVNVFGCFGGADFLLVGEPSAALLLAAFALALVAARLLAFLFGTQGKGFGDGRGRGRTGELLLQRDIFLLEFSDALLGRLQFGVDASEFFEPALEVKATRVCIRLVANENIHADSL